MGEGRTLWLVSDQTRTGAVYEAFLKAFAPGAYGVRRVELPRLERGTDIDRAVQKLEGRLAGVVPARDRLLVVHDWEGELHDEVARRAREASVRGMVAAFRRVTRLPDPSVRMWLIPPTTEGLYLLFAHHGYGEVAALLETWVAAAPREGRRARPASTRELHELIAARGAYAMRRGPGAHVAPHKRDVDRVLRVGHDGPKRELAERVVAALRAPVAVDRSRRPDAACLKGLAKWLRPWAEGRG